MMRMGWKVIADEWRSYAAESAEIKALLQMIQAEAVASSQSTVWAQPQELMAVAINERKKIKKRPRKSVCV